ncbi:hypothetical protein SDC9_152357 [bioreactor metagenome]|uniref:Uncharacterized protein n=1 Tax=bioreactor metagenome TaxID=1076179 RepID=A0A645ETD5_9ZZZZ
MPETVANSRSLNHFDCTFSIDTKTVATPIPTKKRPEKRTKVVGADPKRRAPIPAIKIPTETVILAPRESTKRPTGICIIIYA